MPAMRKGRSHGCSCDSAVFSNSSNAAMYGLSSLSVCSESFDMTVLISRCGDFRVDNPVIAFFFEFDGQFLPTRAHDSPVEEDMDKIRNNVIQEALIMGDDDRGVVRTAQFVYAFGDDFEGVDVQTGIRFVQDGELWLEH